MLPADGDGMTREQIWEALPDGVRKNEVRFKSVMAAETGKLWRKAGDGSRGNPFRYQRMELVTHPGQEEGGEE